jgi:hypothetical protein
MRATRHFLPVLLFAVPLVVIAGKGQLDPPTDDQQLPDEELLEFIAEFELLDGQWIDPIQLNTIFAKNHDGKDND